jgi:hypothetical protein
VKWSRFGCPARLRDSSFPPEPAKGTDLHGRKTRLGRGRRGRRIQHGLIHQFLNLVLLESVHEFPGLARSAELVALLCFVYMNLAILSIS